MVHPYGYHGYHLNRTLPAEMNAYGPRNSTAEYPVLCFCANYGVCGCDDLASMNNSTTNGTISKDKWNTSYALINGTEYSLLNGALANGTTAPRGIENVASHVLGSGFGTLAWVVVTGGGIILFA
jgi:hypothetical protein